MQAFTLGQIDSPASIFLITGGILNCLRTQPENSKESFERMVAAFQRGKKAKFLLNFRLEEQLAKNLNTLRTELLNT